jgi:hypothetical protein
VNFGSSTKLPELIGAVKEDLALSYQILYDGVQIRDRGGRKGLPHNYNY